MDNLNALTIELTAELDEVRRSVRKLVCERRTEDIPGEFGLLRAIVWGIWKEELLSYNLTGQNFALEVLLDLEPLVVIGNSSTPVRKSNTDRILTKTYKILRKTLRLRQYLNERPF